MGSRILRSAFRLNGALFKRTIQNIVANFSAVQNDRRLPDSTTTTSPVSYQFLKHQPTNLQNIQLGADDLLKTLKSEINNLGYIRYANILQFTALLDHEKVSISEADSIFLLESCAYYMPSKNHESRMAVFNRLWNYFKKNNQLKRSQYLAALKVFRANMIGLADVNRILDDSGLEFDSQIYEELIYLACDHGNIKQATEILSKMREKNLPLTVNIFNALIRGHSRNNDLKQCESILEPMKAAGVLPNSDTYSELLMAYIENNARNKMLETLETHRGSFDSQQIIRIIKFTAFKNITEPIVDLVKQLPSDWINVNEIPPPIRNICTELIYSRRIEQAFSIVDAFPKQNFNENQSIDTFGVFFLNDLIRAGVETNNVIDICLKLMDTEKNPRALHVACEIALKRQSNDVLKYLKALSQRESLRPHYFWPLILYSSQYKGEIGILDVLKEMSTLNVEIDQETLSFYVLPHLPLTLENQKEGLKALEACGIKTSQMLSPIISDLIQQTNFKTIISLTQLYNTKLDTSNFVQSLAKVAISNRLKDGYAMFAKTIKALSMKAENPKYDLVGEVLLGIMAIPRFKRNPQQLCQIIAELKLAEMKISSNAADAVCEFYVQNNLNKDTTETLKEMISTELNDPNAETASSQIVHPRDMKFSDLECHLVELESKRMNTRGVLRRLLQICVKEGRHKRALEIKLKCDELNVHVSPGMLASILDLQTKLNNLEEARRTLTQLTNLYPEFVVDPFKIIGFAALLVKNDQLNEAKEVLKECVNAEKFVGGENIMKNLWNLLNQVALLSSAKTDLLPDVNYTKEFFEFLNKSGFCASQNALLGPIIREWILRKDIKSAVAEFNELAEKYNRTPLQFEILSLLVGLSNSKEIDVYNVTPEEAKDLLQSLITSISKIYGTINLNCSLLLAVAESGSTQQLRKILINPEFRINGETLVKNCEHLKNSGKVETLLKLAKASRGLGHVIKEEDIYNLLLKDFIKDNKTNSAINLFNTLEADDDLKISQDFIRNLVRFLKIHNLELPSNIALKAQVL